jgi:anaerobic ribonucleoside-triphosphate reductase activating protein
MNVAHIEEESQIYGPGKRFVIWTQGCSIRCKGCWNGSMWDFAPKYETAASALFKRICARKDRIEGITLLGGEPLDQYEETLLLVRLCREAGFSAMLFTGYETEEIKERGMGAIIENLDILISGRFEEQKRTSHHQWIGSTNQKIIFLTDRYANYNIENRNYTEIIINEDGSVTVLGFPEEAVFDMLCHSEM